LEFVPDLAGTSKEKNFHGSDLGLRVGGCGLGVSGLNVFGLNVFGLNGCGLWVSRSSWPASG
jgi:hypothetical protein